MEHQQLSIGNYAMSKPCINGGWRGFGGRNSGATVPNITLELRSKLVKDLVSSVLTAAGFSVLPESEQLDDHVVVICSLDDYPEPLASDAQEGPRFVVLASEAESLRMTPEHIASLSGVLTYDLSAEAFVRSLRLICAGQRVFPYELTQERKLPTPPLNNGPRPDRSHLSPREKEVLLDLVEGHSNKAIARHLGMTEATVKVHLKSVLRKINVENRTQAAIWALANLPELDAALRGFV